MKKRPRTGVRPTWDFGRKVARIIADRKGRDPNLSTATDLARLVGVDPGSVMDWIDKGAQPGARRVHKVAEILGVDAAWLVDDSRPYDPEGGLNLTRLLAMIPPDQQDVLIKILRDPVERRRWIASWLAGGGT